MRIVTWNCHGALRKKFAQLLDLKADLFIIQECEDPLASIDTNYRQWAVNYLWTGDNKNKGLGIFAKNNIVLKRLDWPCTYQDHDVKYFLPCSINERFNLLAVWAHQNNSPNFGYIGQFWKYLQLNKQNLANSLILGDFNSNAIWDQWDRWWNHSDVVKELNTLGFRSLYHHFTGEVQGKENQPTFYHHKKLTRPYHIDYLFGSHLFTETLRGLSIGSSQHWLFLSDHMPIICEFDISV